jgi:hypothetical protein
MRGMYILAGEKVREMKVGVPSYTVIKESVTELSIGCPCHQDRRRTNEKRVK